MKLLYFHANELNIEAGASGRSPRKRRKNEQMMKTLNGKFLPLLDENNRKTTANNALLSLVCVEKGDEKLDLEKVKIDILSGAALLKASEIVVGAFGHLSNKLADVPIAATIIDELFAIVKASFPATKMFPFGWDKSLMLKIPLHHYNVSFRSFELKADEKAA